MPGHLIPGIDLANYNTASSLILVGSYPRRKNRGIEDSKGVSSYMEHLAPCLSTLLTDTNRRLIILTEKLDGEESAYEEKQMLVLRCWRRNSLTCFWQILRTICIRLRKVRTVLIQFEFNLFGDAAATGSLPLFLLLLRLAGKRPCLMIHQVVEDLAELRVHIGLEKSPVRFALYRRLTTAFYWSMLRMASLVAVHEPLLKERLLRIHARPIAVIPHGTAGSNGEPGCTEARRALGFASGELVLLCFGFLTHYKGSDWIVEEVGEHAKQHPGFSIRLVLAGGESPNYRTKPHYQQFISSLLARAAQYAKQIQVTGFVPNDRVPFFFRAADLVIFPYRTCMSASGPLAIALTFGAPFLLSAPLKGMLASEDFSQACREHGVTVDDLTFELQPGVLLHKATALKADETRLQAMRRVSSAVGEKRNWSFVAREYLNQIQKCTRPIQG